MRDALKPIRDRVAGLIEPYLDAPAVEAVHVGVEELAEQVTKAVVSDLSRDFIIAPRRPLTAVLKRAQDQDSDAATSQIAVLEIALAASRLR